MKITVSKEHLLEKLSDIQSVVEKKTTMQILSHFLLSVSKTGGEIAATDLETAMREPVNIERVEAEGSICIPARKLFEIVKEVEGDLSLSTDDGEWVRIRAGASNFRLACLSADEFPKWPVMEDGKKVTIGAEPLLSMIEKTLYSAGENDTRYTLNGLLFHLQPAEKRLVVVGTDGHRLASIRETLEASLEGELKVIVPRKAAQELRKLLGGFDGDVVLSVGRNHIQFDIGDTQFLTRLIEGTYPSYDQVIPKGNSRKLGVHREEFIRALRRASVMSREKSNAVRIDIKQGTIVLSASNPDLGEARDEIQATYEGEELSLGFNARYLLDALAAFDGEEILMELQDPLSPSLLRDAQSDRYVCVIMPMRT